MENILPYLFLLLAIVVAVTIIKKVASCMIKTVVGIVLIAVLAFVYYFYLR